MAIEHSAKGPHYMSREYTILWDLHVHVSCLLASYTLLSVSTWMLQRMFNGRLYYTDSEQWVPVSPTLPSPKQLTSWLPDRGDENLWEWRKRRVWRCWSLTTEPQFTGFLWRHGRSNGHLIPIKAHHNAKAKAYPLEHCSPWAPFTTQ